MIQRAPIAIIGMGCRFPGGAHSPEALWRLLLEEVDAISEVPAQRFDINAFHDPRPETPGKIVSRYGGFLDGVDYFDAAFFGISPREATGMDPQHRLLLEVAWEALEDAGQVRETLAHSRTGVFIGMWANDYEDLQYERPSQLDIYSTTGGSRSVAAGRLSYALDLHGPSLVVDSACASSLVAVHLACQSLEAAECTLALAGGVNLVLQPFGSIGFSRASMLAPDGRCKFGDVRADGFVRSDGAGIVVLKLLQRAQADGDPIYAVIRGSAVNDDGRGSGFLMTPSQAGQEAVLQEAYRRAGISPGRVQYVEAHGTGTQVGDPVELQALGAVLAQDRPLDRPCLVGSLKTNIGHTEGAAGVAGLIKAALCLRNQAIPAVLHFHEPNPAIPWADLPLLLPRQYAPWPPSPEPAIAGVSSFGISGVNAHVVLEAAPPNVAPPCTSAQPQLLTLSAGTPGALTALARAYQEWLDVATEATPSLYDICYTASVRRTHHAHRLAMVAEGTGDVIARLRAYAEGEERAGTLTGSADRRRRPRIVFVFPGQGSQWLGMGRQLLEHEPVFRASIEECDAAIRRYADWSLLTELTTGDEASLLGRIDVVQPALFALQVALAALWRSLGVEPDAVVGHSMGEVAATHVAGALSLDDAARIICRRSQLLRRVSGKGAMAVVELSAGAANEALAGYEQLLSVAASNSARSTVLSGEPLALQKVLTKLAQQGVFCREVKVDVASHSPQVDVLHADLLAALAGICPQPASIPIYSTLTAAVTDGAILDAAYWARNLREPVRFSTAVQQLLTDGHEVFVEISPHPTLLSAVVENARQFQQDGDAVRSEGWPVVLPSLRRELEDRAVLLESLGVLYTLGWPVDWRGLYPAGGRCVKLPAYPWQRERFWLEDEPAVHNRLAPEARYRTGRPGDHPLLGEHSTLASQPDTHLWHAVLSLHLLPYLADHRVQGSAVLPAAAYVEMALAATTQVYGPGPHTLQRMAFHKALVVPEDGAQQIQVIVSPEMPGTATFQLFSLAAPEATGRQANWTHHASGTIRLGHAAQSPLPWGEDDPREALQARCRQVLTGAEHYQALEARGLQYGTAFQGIEQVWRADGEALARLCLPAALAGEAEDYHVHPALLDASFQVLGAILPRSNDQSVGGATYVPVALDRLRLLGSPGRELWAYGMLRRDTTAAPTPTMTGGQPGRATVGLPSSKLDGDVFLLDQQGQVVLEAIGLRFARLDQAPPRVRDADLSRWFHTILWQPQPLTSPYMDAVATPGHAQGRWLIFADGEGTGKALALRLQARGGQCVLIVPGERYEQLDPHSYRLNPADAGEYRRLLDALMAADPLPCRGIVHLWSLDAVPVQATTLASLEVAHRLGYRSVLFLVQALAHVAWQEAPRLWLITRGAQALGAPDRAVEVAQSPLCGFARTIATEHPELQCTSVDLDPDYRAEALQTESLVEELWAGSAETQVALRLEGRFVARLERCGGVPRAADDASARPAHQIPVRAQDQPFRVTIQTPGILDNLVLQAVGRQAPGPGEVEIEVAAVGLNFRNVMSALGILPGYADGAGPLGIECAGTISALGAGVEHLRVGETVMGLAHECLGSHAVADARLVVAQPSQLDCEAAATIPAAFLTVYYALHQLARLGPGERVLIHSATGGVGLAAIQLANGAGAEIFATAGTPEKRAFLRSLGIANVMDSRSLDFAAEVMELTGGQGVDVVLNSLAGEAIAKSLAVLAPYGRFVELGKRDIYQNSQLGLWPFHKNLTYFAVDVDRTARERPAMLSALLREIAHQVETGPLQPLPRQVYPITQVVDAFRQMAQARHLGKIIISLPAQDQEVLVHPLSADTTSRFSGEGTYLITGGLGGLGLQVARWLVEQGARHLVLVGRRGASADAEDTIRQLEQGGARVQVARADVAEEEQLRRLLDEIKQTMPPLRGIFHAAAVLDDGTLLHLNEDRCRTVAAPKIDGAWNLHLLTLDQPLDLFVLFSSAASLLGSPGQGNYVAANAFLDALAQHRRACGLPALSINWGPWAEVGLAAAQANRGERLAMRGIGSILPAQGVEALRMALEQDLPQVAIMPFAFAQWIQFYPAAASDRLLAKLVGDQEDVQAPATGGSTLRDLLLAARAEVRLNLLERHLREQVAHVLRLDPERVDPSWALRNMGLDSLMALELRNRLEVSIGLSFSVTLIWSYPTVASLASQLAERMGIALAPAGMASQVPRDAAKPNDEPDARSSLEDLSEDELAGMLAQKLATLEERH